jgi:hypothetical protein
VLLQGPPFGLEPVSGTSEAEEPLLLAQMRTARDRDYDQLVFLFEETRRSPGSDPGAVPGYTVRWLDEAPLYCGSGAPVEVAGEARLEIRLQPAAAHTEDALSTVKDRELSYDWPVLREAELACDAEGEVTWIVGASSRVPFRVRAEAGDRRIRVDLQHP